jgi:hypothetical protein
MAVQISDRAGLTKMFDAECNCPVADDATKPGEGRRMTVDNGNQQTIARHVA